MTRIVFTPEDLRDGLSAVPPVELAGMRLLKEQPRLITAPLHIPRERLVEAVTELVVYTERCHQAARSLIPLPPMPLLTRSLPEFGL